MTVLEVILTLALAVTVPAVVWLAVDTWALRRDVDRLDREAKRIDTKVSDLDDMATRTAHNLISTEANLKLDIHALEDARNTTDDLYVPHADDPDTPTTPVYRPVPADFDTNR